MFMKIKIKLAAPEALHFNTVPYGTEDHLPYILGFLLVTEPYTTRTFALNLSLLSAQAGMTRETGYDPDFIPVPCCWPKAVLIVW